MIAERLLMRPLILGMSISILCSLIMQELYSAPQKKRNSRVILTSNAENMDLSALFKVDNQKQYLVVSTSYTI